MALGTLSFLLGNVCFQLLPQLPDHRWPVIILILFLLSTSIFFVFMKRLRSIWQLYIRLFFIFVLGFSSGFGWVYVHAWWRVGHQFSNALEGNILLVEGTIADIDQLGELLSRRRLRFLFDVTSVQCWEKQKNKRKGSGCLHLNPSLSKWRGRIRLNWYEPFPTLRIGEKWMLTVKLQRPHGYTNPGSFDIERWLFQRDIRAVGYVRQSASDQRLAFYPYAYPVTRFRRFIDDGIQRALAKRQEMGLIRALVIGDKSALTDQQRVVLQNTGTSHLLAISGLHIGLVASFMYVLAGWLWRRSTRLMLWLPAQLVGAWGAILGGIAYAALAGFSVATQRAVIMLSVVMIALLRRRQLLTWRGYFIGLLLVLLVDPFATLSSGFWLSFGAVAVIFYGMSNRLQRTGMRWQWWRLQGVILLGLAPFSLLFFQRITLIAFPANLIVIPWIGFLVVPMSLVGSLLLPVFPDLASITLIFASKLLGLSWYLLEWLATWHRFQWEWFVLSPWILGSVMMGLLLLLAPHGWPGRMLGIIGLLPLFLAKPAMPPFGDVWFTLLDVGQGLAAVVQTQHHVLVYDTGPKLSAKFDTGRAVVEPFLRSKGIKQIDLLVISHPDNDHRGGMDSLIKNMSVERVIDTPTGTCYAGQTWQWDGVKFEVIYPTIDRIDLGGTHSNKTGSENNQSCVLRITRGKQHLLLVGDIEKRAERDLVKTQGKALAADILIAPHHGSKTSSIPAFVDAVSPIYVLFGTGYHNRFGFPDPSVIERYRQRSAVYFDTASSGAVTMTFNGLTPIALPQQYRLTHHRYWFGA